MWSSRSARTTLDLLPAGHIPPDPSELLGVIPRWPVFCIGSHACVRQLVLLDSPPLLARNRRRGAEQAWPAAHYLL